MVDPNVKYICDAIVEVAGVFLIGWVFYLAYKFFN